MTRTRYSTHFGLIGMAALWGASWPWGRVVAQAMPPLAAASLRFMLASVVLLLWMQRSGRLPALARMQPRQWLGMAAASAAGVLGYSTFFLFALQLVPAGKAAIVITLNPAMTLLLAALLFREALNWTIGLGVAMAIAGAAWAISSGGRADMLTGPLGLGELLLLGCVICWVAYTLIGRVVLASIDAVTTSTVTAVMGTAMLLVASLFIEGPSAWPALTQAPQSVWLCLVALALGSTALAYAWYFQGVKELGAGAAAGYMALVPVFGLLFSSLWLDEPLSFPLVAGGLLAIAGMVVMHYGRLRAR
ncbi:MAG: DMT family transporter [Comamonas sp.]